MTATIHANEDTGAGLPDAAPVGATRGPMRGVPAGAVLMSLNQLAVMTSNGMEIAEALDQLAETCPHERLADCWDEILEAVSGGRSMSAAVAAQSHILPASLAPMLAAGEATGTVPETLRRMTDRMRSELQMRGTLMGAMIYPALLMGTSGMVLAALVLGVLPQFGDVFVSMGKPVPATTAVLLAVGKFGRRYWCVGAVGVLTLVAAGWFFRSHPIVTRPLSVVLLRGPGIAGAYRPLMAGRVFRMLGSMISGGVPLMDAVRLARRGVGDPAWRGLLDDVEQSLTDGGNASEPMFASEILPAEAASLVATGEKSGRLGAVLEDVADYYDEEATRRIKRLIALFEPAIILSMGVVVAFIVLSVMLPVMDVSTGGG